MLLKDQCTHSNKTVVIKRLLWLLPGPVLYGLYQLSFLWPEFTENVYSRGVYRVIGQGISTVTGILPFSLAEFVLYAFVLFLAVYAVCMIVASVRARREWWMTLIRRVLWLGCALSMIYAVFVSVWGFNYARMPLGQTLGLDTQHSTVDELYQTCEALIGKANALRSEVPQDENGVFSPVHSKEDFMKNTNAAYNVAADRSGIDILSGSFGRVKPVLNSVGMSYADISGYYLPFTSEASVNADMPMLLFGSTCLHEAAHQHGYAREDEANFLAYYVASYSDDIEMRYSGTMLALMHSMHKLYDENSDKYFELRRTYCDGINADLKDYSAYWQQFEGPVAEASQQVNNTYLKANNQDDGVKSYGRMVDLLIGLWRAGEL